MHENSAPSFQRFITGKIFNRWYLIVPAILLFVFIIIRAKMASLTWDEGHTFFEFVRNPRWMPSEYNFMSANNHLLNTWLMKISVSLFGESELALRLPNVLAGGIFLMVLVRLLTRIFSGWQVRLIGFILIACNPYLIDYFSIARGYGISMAMMMCGIYFICKFISTACQLREGLIALLFFALATLANLTCIHLLFSTAFLLAVATFFFGNKAGRMKKIILFLLFPMIFFSLLAPFVFHLQKAGAFFFGREATSPLVVFASLGDAMAYGTRYFTWLSPLLVKLFYLIPLVALIEIFRRRKTFRVSPSSLSLLFLTALFFLSFGIPLLQHYIMGTNFLVGRTAMIFIPQLFLLLLLVVQRGNRIVQVLVSIFALFSLTHFCLSLDKRSFYDFREQVDVKDAMKLLHDMKIPVSEKCFANILSSDLPFEEQINYYRMRFGMDNFGHTSRKENVPACSYYYLTAEGMNDLHLPVDVIREFPQSQTFLFRVRHPQKLEYVNEVWQDFEHEDAFLELKTDTIYIGDKGTFAEATHPYSIGITIPTPDSLQGKLVASLNCRLLYFTKNTSALLVFSFDNGTDKAWDAMHVSELSVKPREWSITGWTRPVPPGTKKVRIYLWSYDKTEVLMDNVALRLLRVAD